ncbi:battenin isoform X2 [Nematostella vectensis]|nr:battenin isoform X2 [Nematostella vectensis]
MWWKLTGLSVTSVGYFFVEAGLLPLTAFYSEKTVFAFSGGTGFGLVGTVYYTVLTTSACVSPRDTLLSAVWLPLIYPAVFYFMDKKLSPSTDHAPYTPLSHTPYSTSGAPDTTPEESLTGVEKLHIVKSLFVYATTFFLGVAGQYLALGGAVTTLAFPEGTSGDFAPRDQFVYYATSFAVGEMVGRSYGFLAMCWKHGSRLITSHLWLFALLIWINVLFLFFASWYRFLPSVWIVVAISFFIGLTAGALYCNAFSLSGKDNVSAVRREFSRAFLVGAFASGLVVGSSLGAVMEYVMRAHCLEITDGRYCITREMKMSNDTLCWKPKHAF